MIAEAQNGQKVAGYCPMGCGQTLVVGIVSKKLLCQSPSCPDPRVIADLLDNERVHHHICKLGEDGFSLVHPLSERQQVEQEFNCNLMKWLSECEGPPKPVGVYYVEEIGPQHFLFHPRDDGEPE